MDDCEKDGDYCKFHQRFITLLETLEAKSWFSNFEIVGEFNFDFVDGEFIKTPKMAQFFKIEFMKHIIIEQIREIEKDESPELEDKPTRLLEKLESFDYDQDFGQEFNDQEGDGPPPPGERRKKRSTKVEILRRKREGGPPPPGGGGPGGPGEPFHEQEVRLSLLYIVQKTETTPNFMKTQPPPFSSELSCGQEILDQTFY